MARADEREVDALLEAGGPDDEAQPSPAAKDALGPTPGLTTFGRATATVGGALLFAGLALGVYPYLLCALLLLGVAFAARGMPAPEVSAARAVSAHDVRAGEPLDVVVEVAPRGAAPVGVTFHDKVPDPFILEDGSNFEAAWLDRAAALAYRLRAPRRGTHRFPSVTVAAHDPLFMMSARVVSDGEADEVVAHPLAPPAPRVRSPVAWGRASLPGGDRASRGVLTNDFRELRPYSRGDPLKSVNWKATARESRDDLRLIVNDYEVEGKKAIWLFIDASPYTVGGTNLESVFDEIASGALAVAGHYLDMGHRVGATVYGSGAARVLYPDVGDLQERRLQAALAAVTPGEKGETLAQAIEASRGFLAREKPLLYVFTLAGRDPSLPRNLVAARAYASTGRRAAPVVAIAPLLEQDGSPAARVVAINEKAQLKGLERRGVTVVRYRPGKVALQALLAKGVLR